MKRLFNKSRILGIKGIFVLSFLLIGLWISAQMWMINDSVNVTYIVQAADTDNGSGFLWSDNFGWISMNCINEWDGDTSNGLEDECGAEQGNYGVSVNVMGMRGEISGYSWSPHMGLICFGTTCTGAPPEGAVDAWFNFDDAVVMTLDGVQVDAALVYGWARIMGHANEGGGDGGWIRLDGNPDEELLSEERGGVSALVSGIGEDSSLLLAGSAWQINENNSGVGWIHFGDAQTDVEPPPCFREYLYENQDIEGNPGCFNSRDDDSDDGINDRDAVCRAMPDLSGRDCLDYDCAGVSFYSEFYPDDIGSGVLRCGNPPDPGPDGEIHEGDKHRADCFDGIDNDLDAWILHPDFRPENPFYIPNPDGGIDCGDIDCTNARYGRLACSEAEDDPEDCYNNFDDDGDGLIDCLDPDCADFVLCRGECICRAPEPEEGEAVRHPSEDEASLECEEGDDTDGDMVRDHEPGDAATLCDNCPDDVNPDQHNTDGDDEGGDVCDPVSWLQTEQGTIYAWDIEGVPPPPGQSTATYCILTSGALVPASFETGGVGVTPCSLPNLALTDPDQLVEEFRLRQYDDSSVALIATDTLRARLDVAGLKNDLYGEVDDITESGIPADIASPDSGVAVYYHQGPDPLSIDSAITFENGSGSEQPGARLILVEGGDLIINNDLLYESPPADLEDLASIGFIVIGGDIIINPGVNNLVGTFVTTGTFNTGLDTGLGGNQLRINGLVVAQQFELARTFADSTRGSEVIIYDGRAALNPPPGFADLVKALPRFER